MNCSMSFSSEQEDIKFQELDLLLDEALSLFQELKSSEFIEVIKEYSEHEFKQNLRLNRSTIFELITTYKSYNLAKQRTVDAELEIYVYIWYLGNFLTLSQIGNLFRLDKEIIQKALHRVSEFIVDQYKKHLRWPSHDECMKNSIKFEQITKISNVVGVMKMIQIKVKAPKYDPEKYLNNQLFYSITAQVIVDANKKFINVYSNEPGSLAVDYVLRNSPIYQSCMQNMNYYFPQNTFILGQSDKYPVKTWLVPPFKENLYLSYGEKRFNLLHYGAGKLAKDAIRQVFVRFRKLSFFNEYLNIDVLTNIIYSAFILHNICIDCNDLNSDLIPNRSDELSESSRRQLLIEELYIKNII